ncbi:hypothetical protein QVD17_01033 [Tagetes erecta]|uniref:Leucine-rich repeat-containing N-terminal plant-type domain-containing protein n=1 Tax=Tagetes erecta TaxID=13708 RepID=A0AAD8P7S3_TARER|nr:hypothetical protein QVD17_01033 [Tagetes erecta]
MANTIFHKHFVHHAAFFFIHSLLVLASLIDTTSCQAVGDFKCIKMEKQALLHFKSYIHQDPRGYLSTWTQHEKRVEEATSDCCEWSGVTCNNQTGHVTSLHLSFASLEGKISPSLVNLTYLSHLDLSSNSFYGPIPMFIGSITQLRYLNLGENYFNETIPLELGNLTKLQELYLHSLSNYTIENLNWLSNLSHLEILYMDGTSLAKANNWVNVIQSLKKLSDLSLSGCDLSQVLNPYSYSSFNSSSTSSSIVYLYLADNNLNSSLYHWLFPLTSNKLQELYLNHNKLDGIPKYLGNLCNLTQLSISQNSMPVKFSNLLANLSSGCTSVALEELYVSYNQLTGSLSNNIQNFSSLKYLYVDNNELNESISENVWRLPKLEELDVSSNSLKSFISEYIGETKILRLYLSNNSFEGTPSNIHMLNRSGIEEIDISSCKLGPHFPNWILKLKKLTHLNIANNRISYALSIQFWNMWFSQLIDLNLSSNNFSGSVPNVSSGLYQLDLSHNKFYGQISFLCQITYGSLYFLDLSNNSFVGAIPDCLWHFNELKVLNIGRNNLSGRLPISIGYLIDLEVLQLDNNKFSGELPLSLQNCTQITFLELGFNKFSGFVPIWIGERLSWLYALSLTSNNFFGTIPSQLCQLVYLQILDLSMNKLNGTIPSCLNNLTSLFHDGLASDHNYHYLNASKNYFDHALIYWQGSVRDKELEAPIIGQNEGGGEGIDELDRLFLIGGASGFATGFWIVCCGLHVNWHGRNEFFRFLDNLKDWVYIKVTLFIARRQRAPYL